MRAVAAFAVLVIAMTWPQALHLSSHAAQHQDIHFNMWRLAWFAHGLATSPARLFDANLFHPEPRARAVRRDDRGYSGVYPPSYLLRLERLRRFPDETSLTQLRRDGVRYVIVHQRSSSVYELTDLGLRLASHGMAELGTFGNAERTAVL